MLCRQWSCWACLPTRCGHVSSTTFQFARPESSRRRKRQIRKGHSRAAERWVRLRHGSVSRLPRLCLSIAFLIPSPQLNFIPQVVFLLRTIAIEARHNAPQQKRIFASSNQARLHYRWKLSAEIGARGQGRKRSTRRESWKQKHPHESAIARRMEQRNEF